MVAIPLLIHITLLLVKMLMAMSSINRVGNALQVRSFSNITARRTKLIHKICGVQGSRFSSAAIKQFEGEISLREEKDNNNDKSLMVGKYIIQWR